MAENLIYWSSDAISSLIFYCLNLIFRLGNKVKCVLFPKKKIIKFLKKLTKKIASDFQSIQYTQTYSKT